MGKERLNHTIVTYCNAIRQEVKKTRKYTNVNDGIHDYPSVAVVASDKKCSCICKGRSCRVEYKEYDDTPKLKNKLKSLGPIGKVRKGCKNIIGACAEPHAAHRVIKRVNPSLSLNQIIFSFAYRPRTMERVDYCKNCTDTFPNL